MNIEAIDFLNQLNEYQKIDYSDYSHLHDLLTGEKPRGEPSDARVQEERIADLRQARNAVSGALAHQLHHRDPDMFFLAVRQMLESARYLVDGYAPGAEDDNREVIDYKALAARLKLEHDEQCEGTYAWGARSGYCRCAERAQGGE